MGKLGAFLAILALLGAFLMAKTMSDRRATVNKALEAEHAEEGGPPPPPGSAPVAAPAQSP